MELIIPCWDELLNNSPGTLVSFYLGQSTDSVGRSIYEIHSWNYEKLESVHNYIQWLFPLTERSRFNPDAPVLDAQQIAAFRVSDELKARLVESFRLMLSFYGLKCDDESGVVKIGKTEEFAQRKQSWLTHRNHNYLRITRILTSLRLLGLEKYAHAFLGFLEQLYDEEGKRIGNTTFGYWKRAVE